MNSWGEGWSEGLSRSRLFLARIRHAPSNKRHEAKFLSTALHPADALALHAAARSWPGDFSLAVGRNNRAAEWCADSAVSSRLERPTAEAWSRANRHVCEATELRSVL